MKPLYQIQSELYALIRGLENAQDTFDEQHYMDEIVLLQIDKTQKLDGCAAYIKQLEAEHDSIEAAIIDLEHRGRAVKKRQESFKSYLANCLPNGETHHSALHDISWRKSQSAEPVNPAIIPPQYMRKKVTYTPNKEDALRDMKMGAVIPGFELVTKQNLQVK